MKLTCMLAIALLVLLVAGPANAKRDPAQRLEQVRAAAGEQIPGADFRVPRFTYDWEVIDDQNIIIWHTRTKAYLVGFKSGVYDLDANTGFIRFEYGGWCDIESVRKLDVKSLREIEKAQKSVKVS
jgi:hypothetical protein